MDPPDSIQKGLRAPSGRKSTHSGGFIDWLNGTDPRTLAADQCRRLDRAADPLGHKLHIYAAMACFFFVSWPTTIMELGVVPLWIAFLARAPRTWRCWIRLGLRPLPAVLILFAAWLAIGLAWSPGVGLGLEELANLRWLLVMLLIWPVLDARRLMVYALAAGFAIGHVVQGLNAWAVHGGPEWLVMGRTTERMSGWWDPAVSGTLLTVALGLHLPAALLGSGRTRLIACGGVAVTLLGLLMTGARGGWIAAAALLVCWFAIAIWRQRGTRGGRVSIAVAAVALVGVVALGATVLRPALEARWNEAAAAVERAREGDFDTSTGARLLMARTALDAFTERPVTGIGTGGFGPWARQGLTEDDPLQRRLLDHAHCTPLHLLACGGLIGGLLGLGVLVVGLRGAALIARSAGPGTYDAGPLAALMGLAFVMLFDTLYVSGQAAAVTGLVLALCAGWAGSRRSLPGG